MSYPGKITLILVFILAPSILCDSLHRSSMNSPNTSKVFWTQPSESDSVTTASIIRNGPIARADNAAIAIATAEAASKAAADAPPHPDPPPLPPVPVIPPPIVPGAGAGLGFHKNIDFSAGKGIGLWPFLSGIVPGFGAAAVQPLPIVERVPLVEAEPIMPAAADPGLFGGLGGLIPGGYLGFPGFTPSYVPSTWLGSALGAKGDLWFPIVIFLFAILGVVLTVHFLLSLIVPLIASKLLLTKGVFAAKKVLRAAEEEPVDNRQGIIDSLTHTVMAALAEEKCLKMLTCQTGNFMRNVAGNERASQISEIVKSFNSTSDATKVFQIAAEKGEDCSKYSCWNHEQKKA